LYLSLLTIALLEISSYGIMPCQLKKTSNITFPYKQSCQYF
jgi:hypothetical protein